MTREREIEILMADGCTRSDAEKHLKNDTTVFDDFAEHLKNYMNEWNIDEEDREAYMNMIETGVPAIDWGVVKDAGEVYYIMYVL